MTLEKSETEPSAAGPIGVTGLRRFGPRTWILAGSAVVAVGLIFKWDWLAAVGAAPIILALLPCAVMCGLGLCMMGGKGKSCSKQNDGDA